MIMFRLRRIGVRLSWSISLLVLLTTSVNGQGEQSIVNTTTRPGTPMECLQPITLEKVPESKDNFHVNIPSDPVMKLLRRIRFPASEDPIVVPKERIST